MCSFVWMDAFFSDARAEDVVASRLQSAHHELALLNVGRHHCRERRCSKLAHLVLRFGAFNSIKILELNPDYGSTRLKDRGD